MSDENHPLTAAWFIVLLSLFPHRSDVFVSPAGGVGDEADDEEHRGEGLNRAANGEDGAADAAAAADGQQGEQVGDHLKWKIHSSVCANSESQGEFIHAFNAIPLSDYFLLTFTFIWEQI